LSRTFKRKQELRLKKESKKLRLTTATTGLSVDQLKQVQQLMLLANQSFAAQKYFEAEKCCRMALALYPKYADPYRILAGIALHFDKYVEAVELYEKALKIAPDAAVTLNNYSVALKVLKRHEDALAALNKCLRLNSKYFDALNNKGSVLSILGQMDKSLPFYEKAIAINPLYGKAYYNIATAHKFSKGDKYCDLFENAENNLEQMPKADQMNVHFALGKYHEDLKNYKSGITHYLKGNKIKSDGLDYTVQPAEELMLGIQNIFNGSDWALRKDVGSQSDVPIFVLGMPRSGTTLTEQILASHSEVFGAGELKLLDKVAGGMSVNKEGFFPTEKVDLEAFEKSIKKRADMFVNELQAIDPKSKHVIDKMPQNFRYIGLVHVLMPRAKIIHCRRNPIDTCLSNFRILFGERMEYTYKLEDIGRYYLAYDRMMKHWAKVLPGRFLDFQYEDVVADIDTQARRLIDHCDLEWEDACLDFHKTKRNVHTASTTQVRQPIYNSSVGRYEKYGDSLKPLLDILAPILS